MDHGKVLWGETSVRRVTFCVAGQYYRQRRGAAGHFADGDHVRRDLGIHRCADGDDFCCERVKTADACGYLADKLRLLRQLLPNREESCDTTLRCRAPDLRGRLRSGVVGAQKGEGKTDGLPDKTSAATPCECGR